jgi:hypothetical protein
MRARGNALTPRFAGPHRLRKPWQRCGPPRMRSLGPLPTSPPPPAAPRARLHGKWESSSACGQMTSAARDHRQSKVKGDMQVGPLASGIDPRNLPLNCLISVISLARSAPHIDGLETGACLRGQRRARGGWKSLRRCDDRSRRLKNDLARAGRHCAVAAASPDPCARACSGDGGRGARGRGVRGAVPYGQPGR